MTESNHLGMEEIRGTAAQSRHVPMAASRPPQKPFLTSKMPGTPFEPAQVYLSFYDLCRQGGAIHITGAYAHRFERFRMKPHQHDRAEFIYIESGKVRLKLYHLSGRRIELDPESRPIYERVLTEGDIVFMDSGVFHELELVQEELNSTIYNVELAPADSRFWDESTKPFSPLSIDSFSLRPLMENSRSFKRFVSRGEPYVRRSQAKDLEGVFHSLVRTFKDSQETVESNQHKPFSLNSRLGHSSPRSKESQKALDDVIAQRNEQAYLRKSLLTAFMLNYARLTEEVEDSAGYPHIETIRGYIEENYTGDLSLDQIARYVNLHPTYVQRIFHLHTGRTVMSYVNDMRIDKACLLLENTSLPVAEIAGLCGFNSRQAFSTAFSKRENINPRDYRASHK